MSGERKFAGKSDGRVNMTMDREDEHARLSCINYHKQKAALCQLIKYGLDSRLPNHSYTSSTTGQTQYGIGNSDGIEDKFAAKT